MTDHSFIAFIRRNAAYSLAMFMERGLAFLLLPLYSHVLVPAEYGVYAVLFSFIAVAAFFYGLGIENNLLTFSGDPGRDDEMMGTAFWSVAGMATFLSCLMLLFAGPISGVLLRDAGQPSLIGLSAGILWTDSLIRFFLYRLLGRQKSGVYVFISLFRGVAGLALNVLFLLFLGMGLKGVFLSYGVSNAVILVFLAILEHRRIRFVFRKTHLRRLLGFGSPVMLTSLFITMLNFFDRFGLEAMVSAEQAGMYGAACRIAFVVNMMVTAFSMGALPFTASLLRDHPDRKDVVSSLMTFSSFTFVALFVFLSLFTADLVRIRVFGYALIHASYWKSLALVPILALGYVLYGFFVNFSLLFFHTGRTMTMAKIVFGSLLANLLINAALIPSYGAAAAAGASVAGFLFMAVAGFTFSRRIFPVRYAWGKILPMSCAGLLIYVLTRVFHETGWQLKLFLYILFVVSFLFILFPGIRHISGRSNRSAA